MPYQNSDVQQLATCSSKMFNKVVVFLVTSAISHASARTESLNLADYATDFQSDNFEPNLNSQATVDVTEEETNRRSYVQSDNDDAANYEKHIDFYAYPKYNFKYGVDDQHTGDKKFHFEERDGDKVKGQYKVIDADGYIRIVDYTADKTNGFKAVVARKENVGYGPVHI